MRQEQIIDLAKSHGFVTNHFLVMKDKKSGVIVSGIFTKYKQHETNGLRIKGTNFEVEIIKDREPNFEILRSINLNKEI
jgi:hypothetical protein